MSDKGFNRYSHELPAPVVVMLNKQSCKWYGYSNRQLLELVRSFNRVIVNINLGETTLQTSVRIKKQLTYFRLGFLRCISN